MGENKRRQKMSSKKLNVTSLLEIVRHSFSKIKGIEWISRGITSTDCLMSGLALFGLKYPSLLQFNSHYSDSELIQENMRTLYKVEKVPSDTYMRERLDEIDHRLLRKPFSSIFAMIQRSGELEQFQYLNGFYLCSVDGSGFFHHQLFIVRIVVLKNIKMAQIHIIIKCFAEPSFIQIKRQLFHLPPSQ